MKQEEQKSDRRRSFLPYGLGVAVLAVVIGLGVYSLKHGLLGSEHLEAEKESPIHQQEGGPHSEGEDHEKAGVSERHAEEDRHEQKAGEGHREAEAPEGQPQGVLLSSEEQANIGLETTMAALRVMEDVRKINGIVKPHPDKVALVTSRVAGKAVAVHVNVGDQVKKGQDLADIQSVELERIELDLIQAENKLTLAKAELDRVKGLVEKGIAARRELVAAENRRNAASNEIEGLIRQLILLGLPHEEIPRARRKRAISTLHLRAPLGGTIVERNMTLGQTIEPNTPLFRILDTSKMLVEGEAFEDVLPLLRKGQEVRVTVSPYPDRDFRGRITFISSTVDLEKRTVHIWVEVDNHHGMLKEGFFARLFVAVRERSSALTIPVEALVSAQGEEFVFVDQGGGVFVRRDLVVGARDDRYAEVKRGLQPGERVVTDGNRQLYTKYLMSRAGGAALGGHGH